MGKLDFLRNKIKKNTTKLAEIANQLGKIQVLEQDPDSPANGQFWLLKYYELLRDSFTGADGDALNSSIWEVVKTKTTGSTATHAATNKADIRSNRAQFNIAAAATIEDGGYIELLARMKKFEVDWSTEARTITWKQNPYKQWGDLDLVLSSSVVTEGGGLLPSYAIRVDFSSANASLQMKNAAQTEIVYNQSFAHGASLETISEFKLVIDPLAANVTLFQDGVQKLTTVSPNIGVTKAWLYLYLRANSVTPTIRNFDDIVIE